MGGQVLLVRGRFTGGSDFVASDCISFDPIVADLDGDGSIGIGIGIGGLLSMLRAWGPCQEGACPADLDRDGSVWIPDLVILLSST